MEDLRQYVIAIAVASWIVGCMGGLIQNPCGKALIRLVGGVFLAITLLTPMSDLNLGERFAQVLKRYPDGEIYVSQGTEQSRQTLSSVIVSETEAYILDKAKTLGAEITVEIQLSGDEIPVPCEAQIHGVISPQAQQVLSDVMEQELGITKENQTWTS